MTNGLIIIDRICVIEFDRKKVVQNRIELKIENMYSELNKYGIYCEIRNINHKNAIASDAVINSLLVD